MLACVAGIEPATHCLQRIFFLTDWPGRVFCACFPERVSITRLFKIGQLRVLAALKILP